MVAMLWASATETQLLAAEAWDLDHADFADFADYADFASRKVIVEEPPHPSFSR